MFLRRIALLATFVLTAPAGAQSLPAWAAPSEAAPLPSSPPVEAVPTLPSQPTQVPIDGGVGLLLLVGVSYAARKLRRTPA